ncbi:MAG: SDR family oxidoreductase [Calditrichia bacterium]
MSQIQKKKVLITGSSGFLGRYLVKFSPVQGYQLHLQYRSKRPDSYGRNARYIELDFLRDDWGDLEFLEPDIIIHTAAMGSIDQCEVKPEISHHINFEVVRRLADYAANWGSRFIFLSSDVVFDGKKGDYKETDATNPLNLYGRSKVEAEDYLLAHLKNVVVVRPSLFYGRSLNGRPSFAETMLQNLYAGKQVFLFNDQYRTPIWVQELALALWELAEADYSGILHLGGSQKCNRVEMGMLLCEMFDLDPNLIISVPSVQSPLIAKRPLDCSLNTQLVSRVLKTRFSDCKSGFSLAFR